MNHTPPRWTVRKRNNQWRVYDRGIWSVTFDTLTDAHTWATQCAVADILYQPGGLTILAAIKDRHTATRGQK